MKLNEPNLKVLSDVALERIVVTCRELTRQTCDREEYHGMAPYNLWVKVNNEQGRRELLKNKTHCEACGQLLD